MTDNRLIPAQPLAEYVAKNEVAWQMCEGLIEFSRDAEYEFAEGEKEEYEERNTEMLTLIKNAKECRVFNPETDDCAGFEDLTEWSEGKDLLILVDNVLLLCIALCYMEQVLAMAA